MPYKRRHWNMEGPAPVINDADYKTLPKELQSDFWEETDAEPTYYVQYAHPKTKTASAAFGIHPLPRPSK